MLSSFGCTAPKALRVRPAVVGKGNFAQQAAQVFQNLNIALQSVGDSESESVSKNHDGWKRGIRIGKIADGRRSSARTR
jgi:hypothetical protein